MELIRWTALAILILFSLYTIYATKTESFWKSTKAVLKLKWGRQAVTDLYIGLLLFNFIIFLNEGSALIMLAWLVPTLLLGNIVPLIYFVLNFESLISHFPGL